MAAVSIGGLAITNPLAVSPTTSSAHVATPAAVPVHTTSVSPGNGAYWIGSDGNVYLKGPGGNSASVTNLGSDTNLGSVQDTKALGKAVQIDNPNPTKTSTTQNPGNTASTTTNAGVLSPAEIAATQASINNGIAQNQAAYNVANQDNLNNDKQQYADEQGQEQLNTGNRAAAVQNAEQAAASGSKGLDAVLASLGALDGTGSVLAGRAVANSANSDIGAANQTYTTNDEAVQKAIKDYATQVATRNAALKNSLGIDNRNTRMTGLQDEVNAAENVGDTSLVSQLLPQLAAATAPSQQLVATPVIYNPAAIGSYAPSNSLTVTAAPSTPAAANTPAATPVNSPLNITKTAPTPGY